MKLKGNTLKRDLDFEAGISFELMEGLKKKNDLKAALSHDPSPHLSVETPTKTSGPSAEATVRFPPPQWHNTELKTLSLSTAESAPLQQLPYSCSELNQDKKSFHSYIPLSWLHLQTLAH